MLGAAGRSEDPASAVQESMAGALLVPLLDLTSAVPRALSAQEGSNNTPVDGVMVSGEAGHSSSSIPSDNPDLRRDSTDEDSNAGCSDQEEAEKSTHPVSPSAQADAPDHPLLPGSSIPATSSVDHLQSSPCCSSSSRQQADLLDFVGKLALVDQHPPGSGQLSPDLPNPTTATSQEPAPFSSPRSPDRSEPPEDSSGQLCAKEAVEQELEGAESKLDLSSALDVTLEGGDLVPIDWAMVEQLRTQAAECLSLWEDCLSHMTVHEHPHCEYPPCVWGGS